MAKSTSDDKNKTFGGLKVGNTEQIDPKFICEFCRMVLLCTWQLQCCGALLCKYCLLSGLPNSEPFICPLCRVKQPKKEALLDRGAERELRQIFVVCYSCTWQGSYSDYLEHLREQHADLECLDCHARFFAINSLEEHRQEFCPERSIPCGLPDCGNTIKHYNMRAHYLSTDHQYRIVLIIAEHRHPRDPQRQDSNHLQFYYDIQESIGIAFSTYEILYTDLMRLTSEMAQKETNFESNVSKIEGLKNQEKENEKSCKEVAETLAASQNLLENAKRTREESQILTLDANSTVIFRLDRPADIPFSTTGTKFQTSQHGYRFQPRWCSTMDQNEQYFSIFLTLCNGEYYNLLPFPFPYSIYFILWDQSNQGKHIERVLKPDLTSPACARPTSENNNEFGIIQFCPLQYLTDPESIYVKDDVCFLRIFIDFLDTGQNPFQSRINNIQDAGSTITTMITD